MIAKAMPDVFTIDGLDDDSEVAANLAEYRRHARGVLADLETAGFPVIAVQDLVDRFAVDGLPYHGAIPVLTAWLPKVAYRPLKEDIARTLSVPWAREAVPVLLGEFYRQPPDDVSGMGMRFAIANALAALADETILSDLIAIAGDRQYGESRATIVSALGKFKKSRPVALLSDLLDDPSVSTFAIEALGDLRAVEAREAISKFATHSDSYIRNRAKSALKKIDRHLNKRT